MINVQNSFNLVQQDNKTQLIPFYLQYKFINLHPYQKSTHEISQTNIIYYLLGFYLRNSKYIVKRF